MSDEYLFISDCHADAGRPEITQALVDFLQTRARDASHLYILGDLFEVWLGDDDPADEHLAIVAALRDLARCCEIFFLAGNRDFLLGQAFADRVGMTLQQEPVSVQLGRASAVLLHGDSLCTDDHDYQKFRNMVRDPQWISQFLSRPLPERQQVAAQLRERSVEAMSAKSTEIMDVNADAVSGCFVENETRLIIHGHTHRPAIHSYADGLQRIVLGDWNPGPSYLSWSEDEGFRLVDSRL